MKKIPFENILLFAKSVIDNPVLNKYRYFEDFGIGYHRIFLADSIHSDTTNKREELVNVIDISEFVSNININTTIRQLIEFIVRCNHITSINMQFRMCGTLSEIRINK